MRTEKKLKLRQLRRWRIRKKVSGTGQRPRMAVCFTAQNIHVQFIDDTIGKTLAAAGRVLGPKGAKGGARLWRVGELLESLTPVDPAPSR